SGFVYLDYDRAETFTENDVGLPGAVVKLTGTDSTGNHVSLQTTTDNNGFYIFADLLAGTYTLTLVPPGGTINPEVANVGTVNNTTDGSATSTSVIDQVMLHLGNTGLNYNFGLTVPQE